MIWSSRCGPRVARRGTFSKTISLTGLSFQALHISHRQRRVSSLSAWYFGVRLRASDSSPDAPLRGDEMNRQSGVSLPAARS